MKLKTLITMLFLATLLTGCSGVKTAIVSEAKQSYLFFNGNIVGAEYSIDKGAWYKIVKTGENELYPAEPGKQRIQVRKNGVIVVDKLILLGDSAAKEIKVP